MAQEVITFAGGGGKTTSVYTYAAKLAADGKKVLIMTTTHMGMPERREIFSGSCDPFRVRQILAQIWILCMRKAGQQRTKNYSMV